jgi:hypothetical protein
MSSRFRARRFGLFLRLIRPLPRPISILDVGGTQRFWEAMGLFRENEVDVTLLNLREPPTSRPNFHGLAGDARAMTAFEDGRFDVAFSNSVLEHVGGYEDQARMASEMRRVAGAYFVQAPNRRFPLEPHVVFPFFQYLPISARTFLLRHVRMGNREGRIPDKRQAESYVRSIRLPTRKEMSVFFPRAPIYREKVLALTKSFVAYGGFPA